MDKTIVKPLETSQSTYVKTSPHHTGLASIIIPNYNHAQYLGDAIQSVLNQAYRNFEIIVVDDGSTDNSREVAAQFGDQIIYIWQENQGLSAARNTGLRAAKGDYIGVLDADDMYEPAFLSTLVSILEIRPDVEAVYCGYQFVDYDNKDLPQIEARTIPSEQLYQALVDGNFLVPEAMFVRKRCYDRVGFFDESLRACEDTDMWLRITSRFKVISSPLILTRHRVLPNSMSTDPIRQCKNRLAVIEKHFGPEPKDNLAAQSLLQRRAYGLAYLAATVEHLQCQKEKEAYNLFKRMVQLYPEALTELNTFYELGCGNQPKGARGYFATLDLDHNAAVLLSMLDRLFNDPQTSTTAMAHKNLAIANGYWALGLLSYGKKQSNKTRNFITKSVQIYPKFGLKRAVISIYIKSLLGSQFTDFLKQNKKRVSNYLYPIRKF